MANTNDPTVAVTMLLGAAQELLNAAGRTNFYDCGIEHVHEKNFGEGNDDMSVDGGCCPLTLGHLRRLQLAVNNIRSRGVEIE